MTQETMSFVMNLVISLRWPIVAVIIFCLIYELVIKLQDRKLTYKERRNGQAATVTNNRNEQNVAQDSNIAKYKILLDYTLASDNLKWKQLHIFSLLMAGLVASLFVQDRNISLSAIVGIVTSCVFLMIALRSNAWHGYLIKQTRSFAGQHTGEDNFFSPLAKVPDFKWYQSIPAYIILLGIPIVSLIVWIVVLVS